MVVYLYITNNCNLFMVFITTCNATLESVCDIKNTEKYGINFDAVNP